MKVVKFGGSSLANAAQVQKVVNIIKADDQRRFVVVSAPGKRFAGDIKVTDLLITYANDVIKQRPLDDITTQIISRYQEIAQAFHISDADFNEIKAAILQLPDHSYQDNDYLMAAFKAHGEKLNAILFAKVLTSAGLNAKYLDPKDVGLVVTDRPNDADIIPESYDRLGEWAASSIIRVIPGFFGYNLQDQICTFSRGGSDITGAIVARGVHADRYENFTDVNAIYAANPKVVENPIAIHHMTFREMRELAYAGFSVFHDEALIPAIQGDIEVVVKNTNHPSERGTSITSTKRVNPAYPVSGIASSPDFCGIYIRKYMLDKKSYSQKILNILAQYGLSYEHMPSGIDDLTVIMKQDQLTPDLEDLLIRELVIALHPDEIHITHDYALLMVVGEGMLNRTGLMSKATDALARQNVKLVMVNQGASEISMMFGIQQDKADASVQALYDAFFPDL
ncbi:aspartate kinase [Secundilactobacillus paracollinoides]|uniref:Aspartokinase n=1 Tax=Secundilactobacillus paracollinoides TaxID=240427 RepID=A0A1B2J2B9_9LACO|nr:aspartate kinase [Secundilactobacillus paracollinoides]ANZ61721.1 aspartate kinase [Secundilactobacillus paracollinoides]ANZ68451.1 aspartate kinase [Secundilactobacillus paracollinoides]